MGLLVHRIGIGSPSGMQLTSMASEFYEILKTGAIPLW